MAGNITKNCLVVQGLSVIQAVELNSNLLEQFSYIYYLQK